MICCSFGCQIWLHHNNSTVSSFLSWVSGRCSGAPDAAAGPLCAGSRRGSEDSGRAGCPCVYGCGWWGWSSGWTPSHISDTHGASPLSHKHSTSHLNTQDVQTKPNTQFLTRGIAPKLLNILPYLIHLHFIHTSWNFLFSPINISKAKDIQFPMTWGHLFKPINVSLTFLERYMPIFVYLLLLRVRWETWYHFFIWMLNM